ncbi:MAG: hypothetical protein WAQ29_04800 [Nitrososphaeraceae archaeon]
MTFSIPLTKKVGVPLISTQSSFFYTKMFSDAGFPLTANQLLSDALVDNVIISGNEDIVAARFTELLTAGLDEPMVNPVPIKDAIDEMRRLMHLIGQL